ncbi:MAG: hypothetical protein ACXABY_01410 [Candidatus Thorarchaeota archaeon]
MGYRGVWWSTIPPPPDTCTVCGAVAAYDVIQMVPCPYPRTVFYSPVVTTSADITMEDIAGKEGTVIYVFGEDRFRKG